MTIITLVGMIAIMWFFMIRPQRKQQEQLKIMRDALKVGDQVITIGGIIGKVVSVTEDEVEIVTSGQTKMNFRKSAISVLQNANENELEAIAEPASATPTDVDSQQSIENPTEVDDDETIIND